MVMSYCRKLLKSKLKAFGVVGYPFGGDVLHRVLQQLLVPYIGLYQIFKTGCLLHPCVKLEDNGRNL